LIQRISFSMPLRGLIFGFQPKAFFAFAIVQTKKRMIAAPQANKGIGRDTQGKKGRGGVSADAQASELTIHLYDQEFGKYLKTA
jgi:hypothetical protein